jgi:NitT/TauT family transport system ATP-binding protein
MRWRTVYDNIKLPLEVVKKQDVENQNVRTQNVRTQNVEKQNVKKQNVEKQNVEKQNVEKRGLANVDRLIEMMGMKGFEKSYPLELSGGMQRRVSIARAFVHEPSIILMDEPFTGVDELTKEALQYELGSLIRNLHVTVMLVTHDIEEAVFLSDRIFVMSPRPGALVAEVTVNLPFPRDPSMRSVPEFVAAANSVRGELLAMHAMSVDASAKH